MKSLNYRLSLVIILILGLLLGNLFFASFDKPASPLERIAWSPKAQWITTPSPSYRLYARHTLNLSDNIQAAWLRISADNNFILYVNGKQVGRQLGTTNSSLPFTSRNTFSNQNINDSNPYNVRPENRFIAYPRNWKLTFYADLSDLLHTGKNVIAIEVQKPQENVRVVLEGVVYPVRGVQPLSFTTGEAEWKVSALAENYQRMYWFEPDFPDQDWTEAQKVGAVQEGTYSRLSQNLYDRFLEGAWITGNANNNGQLWLQGIWNIDKVKGRAFIRFSGDREYSLLLNGKLISSYDSEDKKQLHMFEVTNLLKTGKNVFIARLIKPLGQMSESSQINQSLGFFLDGWMETSPKEIITEFATDSNWRTSTQFAVDESGKSALVIKSPNPQEFDRQFEGNAYLLNYPDFLWRNWLWQILGVSLALFSAWFLGKVWLRSYGKPSNFLSAGSALLLPSTLFLLGISLIEHRYAESEQGILFAQSYSNGSILLGFIIVQTVTLFWSFWQKSYTVQARDRSEVQGHPNQFFRLLLEKWHQIPQRFHFSNWGQWILFAIIITVGFGLRVYHLDATARDSDENTSLDAIRGILRTGAPVATSGIWYTRGPLYHYVVAMWLRLVGYSTENARFSSVIFGTVTLVIVFFIVRKFTGKVWLSLVVIAILAIDPWELAISRNTRFYQFLQMNVMFAFWFFAKGFIFKEGRIYQLLFFISTTAFLLTQEGSITLLPCFIIGFLYFYHPFRLAADWKILLGGLMMLSIYVFNGIFFIIRCLTPSVGLSSGTSTPIKLHFNDITGFTLGLLIGNARINVLYSLFFLLGFIYFLWQRQEKLLFLFTSVLIFLLNLTILVSQVSPRYSFAVYPIFITLSVYSAFCILGDLGRSLDNILKGLLPLKAIAMCWVILLLVGNLEPARVLAGYQQALARQNPQLFDYLSKHLEPGDVVVANLPAAAAIALNRLDYYLPSQGVLSLDGFYLKDGRMIDRWAGGELINSTDRFASILEKSNRVWIQLDDNPQPKEPNQRQLYDYVRTLGRSVYEPYGVRLRLWQRADGIFPRDENRGKDIGNY